jgi:hypothetical protein
MAARKKSSAKKSVQRKPAARKPAAKKAPRKTAPKKTARKPAAKAAPAPKREPARLAPPAAPPRPAPVAAPAPAPAPGGAIRAEQVTLGHVMALRPRIHVGFKPSAFADAKRALADEGYATIEAAARAVAEKAIELTNAPRGKYERFS